MTTRTRPLQVGVVGLGMGRDHVRGFEGAEGSSVVAICDRDETRLQEAAADSCFRAPPRSYDDLDRMLEKEALDIVAIATPNCLHLPMARKAFAHGCHVFCEKPPSLDEQGAITLKELAEAAGRRLMYNLSFRFREPARALKRQVAAGALGHPYHAHSRWLRRREIPAFGGWFGQKDKSGGGPLIDLGVHRLDLALWLLGHPEPEWVLGGASDHLVCQLERGEGDHFDVEDFACAMVRFREGQTLLLETSWTTHIGEEQLMETRILGTKGGLRQHNPGGDYSGLEAEIFTSCEGVQANVRLTPPWPDTATAMAHFVDDIRQEREPSLATPEEGIMLHRILDAIYASASAGQPVRLKTPGTARR